MGTLIDYATFKIRRDTATNWTSNDPTPLEGEWCLETDTGRVKIGDGSTAWTDLAYTGSPNTQVYNITTATDETHTLPDANTQLTEHIIKRRGSGAGKVTITPSGTDKIELEDQELSTLVMGGASTLVLVPVGGNWEVKSFKGSYRTGWINRSDWTNVHLGSDDTKNVDSNVTHGLGLPLPDIDVKLLISETGSDSDAFEIKQGTTSSVSHIGFTINAIDDDNCKIQLATGGVYSFLDTGGALLVNTQDWYYKVKVKFNF